MHLVVFSYKPCWASADSPSGFVTDGGFPLQIEALSRLFDRTTLLLPRRGGPAPDGAAPIRGRGLKVETFAEPRLQGIWRKAWWLASGLILLPRLWRMAGDADAVHALVPGDVGFLGLLVSLARRQRIVVRHCGTWGRPGTLADRFLHQLLLRVAGERCVVFATGGGEQPPAVENPSIRWIFSTSLSERELEGLKPAERTDLGAPRLICVGRLTRGKNIAAAVRALAALRRQVPEAVLDVVGDGPEMERLLRLALDLDLGGSVTFHGNVDHAGVLDRLRRASVLLFPTRVAEGFPKAVLESLACGVPVVAPKVSVLPHLLRTGGGLVVGDVEPGTLAAAAYSLLESETHARHAKVGRRLARRYTLEAWCDAIEHRLTSAWGERLSTGPEARR